MGRRRAKPRPGSKAARMHATKGVGWQLWAVAGGVLVLLVLFGAALFRGKGVYRTEFQGTVVAKTSHPQPGAFDPHTLRQLTLEQEDGRRVTVEVEANLFETVEEGYFVHRSRDGSLEVRDAEGRDVATGKPEPDPG